jgi:phosphatidylglycerophosphatase A
VTGVVDRVVLALATFFGSGRFPFAPATFASLVFAVPLYVAPPLSLAGWIATTLIVTALAIPISTRAERAYGKDGSAIVIDEIAGMVVTLFAMPKVIWIYAAGFFLFRVYDVLKPFPAGRAQRLPGGWGVVLDDVAAGIYAHLTLRLLVALVER